MCEFKHIAGGHCCACNKMLSDIEQGTRGKLSGIELSLCRTCSNYVNGDPFLDIDRDDVRDTPWELSHDSE